jgi:transposase-like protein
MIGYATYQRTPRRTISRTKLAEMMGEHGVAVDHSMLNRWIPKYVPLLEKGIANSLLTSDRWAIVGDWTT